MKSSGQLVAPIFWILRGKRGRKRGGAVGVGEGRTDIYDGGVHGREGEGERIRLQTGGRVVSVPSPALLQRATCACLSTALAARVAIATTIATAAHAHATVDVVYRTVARIYLLDIVQGVQPCKDKQETNNGSEHTTRGKREWYEEISRFVPQWVN